MGTPESLWKVSVILHIVHTKSIAYVSRTTLCFSQTKKSALGKVDRNHCESPETLQSEFGQKIQQMFVKDKSVLVYLKSHSPRRDDRPSHKLRPKKSGPFEVVAATSKTAPSENDGNIDIFSTDRVPIAQRKDECRRPLSHAQKTNTSWINLSATQS